MAEPNGEHHHTEADPEGQHRHVHLEVGIAGLADALRELLRDPAIPPATAGRVGRILTQVEQELGLTRPHLRP